MISYNPIIQNLSPDSSVQLDILRLDLIDKEISGNKWFKLKNNLEKAKELNLDRIITCGGAFSNHIAATASACRKFNLKPIGIIRGEEVSNPTLKKAEEDGMKLYFVSRELYSQKNEEHFKSYLEEKFGKHYFIPEGGNNIEGIRGCMEIVKPESNYDYILCACGTATTYAGIVANKKANQKVIGISVLKGENKLPKETEILLRSAFNQDYKICSNEALNEEFILSDCIINSYAFNGYAKADKAVLEFKIQFEKEYELELDYVYTSKLLYAAFDLVEKNKFKPDSKVLVIHSGGLQGNKGFEERYHLSPSL